MEKTPEMLFAERLALMETAQANKETDRVPVAPFFSSLPQRLFGSSYQDLYYDYDNAGRAALEFYKKYPVDAAVGVQFTSGPAQDIAGPSMIDWPGRPGGIVSKYSSHQVIENEYIQPEEYRALIDDFDGFMLTRYVPRAFPGLKAFGEMKFNPFLVLSTGGISQLFSPNALEAYEKLKKISELEAAAAAKSNEYNAAIWAMGIAPYFGGAGEVPFDIISDYFRTTLGAMTDSLEYEDEMLELMDILADRQIAAWKYLEFVPMPTKRIFFPLHKGMDGFMSADHYERLYLAPFKKMLDYLVSVGATPIIYTEGRYNTRLEALRDFLPEGKCIVHFETADMAKAKKTVGAKNCISGNLSAYTLECGTVEQTIEETKYLIDTCAPGGGYIFDTNACIENAKVENLEAMLETLETYGKK